MKMAKAVFGILAIAGFALPVSGGVTLLSEDFESGVLDSRITISTRGTFSEYPGITNTTVLGGSCAFGFGKSTCPANCWLDYVTFMSIKFPGGTNVSELSFSSIEVDGNWGSTGYVFVDPTVLPSTTNEPADGAAFTNAFGSFDTQPNNTPTGSNTFVFAVNQWVTNIVIMVTDITDVSEILIADLLVTGPSPHAATATATVVNGFFVGATITDNGYGYTNTPGVRIIGGGGSGAQAVAVVSNGVVIAVNILDTGSGYADTPVIVIAPPFIAQPTMGIVSLPVIVGSTAQLFQLGLGGLSPYDNYQLEFAPTGRGAWSNFALPFLPTSTVSTQDVIVTGEAGFFRLKYVP
jgi:hypothetical protein